ncbi:conserved hypothetical protein [Coccidioides posadasii str. Silveira]|uniref:RING-type domain-containing protein n=2 Tax=Coccidioides posadasii TaxID=199306 RepID=E9DAU5_COCPS|nr:conserved hypothetical protein [Coccidioides posadasii str. Silveira]KMM66962.1 hypothetical protein CPAG_03298 [Coccidioides posadasii RMSCC 3488]
MAEFPHGQPNGQLISTVRQNHSHNEAEQERAETFRQVHVAESPALLNAQGEISGGQISTASYNNWNIPTTALEAGATDRTALHPFSAVQSTPEPQLGDSTTSNGASRETVPENNNPQASQPRLDHSFQNSWDAFIAQELERRAAFAQANHVPVMATMNPNLYHGQYFYPGPMTTATDVQLLNQTQVSGTVDNGAASANVSPATRDPHTPQGSPSRTHGVAHPEQVSGPRRSHMEAFTMDNRHNTGPSEYRNTRPRLLPGSQEASFAAHHAALQRQFAANGTNRPLSSNQQRATSRYVNAALRHFTFQHRGQSVEQVNIDLNRYAADHSGASTVKKGLDNQNDGRPKPKESSEMKIDFDCQICRSQTVDTVIIPCGHAILCQWCAEQHIPTFPAYPTRPREHANCPLCRKPVRERYRIFTP